MTDVARPTNTSDMQTEDNTVYSSTASRNSIAGRTKEQLREEANSAKHSGIDPLAARGVLQEEDIPGFVPGKRPTTGIKITGTVDPIFGKSGFSIGDRVYHKVKKMEGTVKDLMASGKVIVELSDGRTGKMNAENIVKL